MEYTWNSKKEQFEKYAPKYATVSEVAVDKSLKPIMFTNKYGDQYPLMKMTTVVVKERTFTQEQVDEILSQADNEYKLCDVNGEPTLIFKPSKETICEREKQDKISNLCSLLNLRKNMCFKIILGEISRADHMKEINSIETIIAELRELGVKI
jgi:hypothetical protein